MKLLKKININHLNKKLITTMEKYNITFQQGNSKVELVLAPEHVAFFYEFFNRASSGRLTKGEKMQMLGMTSNVDSAIPHDLTVAIKESGLYPIFDTANHVTDFREEARDAGKCLTNLNDELVDKMSEILDKGILDVTIVNRVRGFRVLLKEVAEFIPKYVHETVSEYQDVKDWKSIHEALEYENEKENNALCTRAYNALLNALPYYETV